MPKIKVERKEPEVKRISVQYGDIILYDGEVLMVAQVDFGQLKLVGLDNGNRYSDQTIDKGFATLEEVGRILGTSDFEHIPGNRVEITIKEL